MKDSIKRAQSRAGSGFAERENFRPKVKHLKKTLLTLVALLALTTQAWAEESEIIETKTSATTVYTGTHFKINASLGGDAYGIILWDLSTSGKAKIEALNGEIITWIEMHFRNGGPHATLTTTTEGDLVATDSEYAENDISVTDINATSVTIGTTYSDASGVRVQIDKFVIHYANPVPLNWDATAKTASIAAMPAGNVTVNVKYFAQAEFATRAGETPELLAPAPIPGVPANTDDPIVTPGTVANIGTSEVKQGTLMYYVSQTAMTDAELLALDADKWSADVPTANGLAEGAAYVYYYIQGAEPAEGTERTDANTCSDGDILAANVVPVTLDPEPSYTVELNDATAEAANWKAAKGTDTPAAFPLEGVKKGDKVTVKYTPGRKVIGVKAEKKGSKVVIHSTASDYITLNIDGCTTWEQIVNLNRDILLIDEDGYVFIIKNRILLQKSGGSYVNKSDTYDPSDGYYYQEGD